MISNPTLIVCLFAAFDGDADLIIQEQMKNIEGKFIVLEEDISHKDFLGLAEAQGWNHYRTYSPETEKDRFEDVWHTTDNKNTIHFIEDPITGTRYIWAKGSNLKEVLFKIHRWLPAYEPEELIQMAVEADQPDEAIDALFRIAVAFPNFNEAAIGIFKQYLSHPSKLIRKATVQAIAYRAWSEGIGLLEKVSDEDVEVEVREFAKILLSEIDQQ